MALQGKNDNEKLAQLLTRTYKEQTIWFLNAFWDTFASQEAERLWGYIKKCTELDLEKHEAGNGLDEVRAHKFLESFGETLTVLSLREKLRQTGAIPQNERPKLVPITHYLLFRYNVDWHQLVNTAGDNSEEIAQAQTMLNEVIAAFQESDRQAQNAKNAENHAKKEEAAAREQEAPFKAAQEEVDSSLAEVKSQEEARNSKTELLKKQSEEGGVVQQNKAKNQLAQHLNEDPLPLRKAKVTLEAALKKAEKARAPFEAATKRAEEARREAEASRRRAEDAVEQCRQRVQAAEDFLEEVKRKPGTPHGAIWWLERELAEQKSYLPERRGGGKKN
jgi:DNA repair exonuclease SbcCD ATPase subunit